MGEAFALCRRGELISVCVSVVGWGASIVASGWSREVVVGMRLFGDMTSGGRPLRCFITGGARDRQLLWGTFAVTNRV